jgi:hypothetical protein
MDKQLDLIVRHRANYRCDYCLLPQSARRLRFQIDHIIAEQHGGKTTPANPALSSRPSFPAEIHQPRDLAP